MSRFPRTTNFRRIRLKRIFLYLICLTTIVFLVLSWWSYFTSREGRIVQSLRSVQEQDYKYYYNIDVEELKVQLSEYQSAKNEDKDPFTEHYFNRILSDILPLDRKVPDTRDPQCLQKSYRIGVKDHQSVSVIISYHNEALSALLRTILSILHRTPPDLLREIILVDDFSEKDFLKILLKIPKIKYLKNDLRLGLIKSRNRAAESAKGNNLIFMDSHCEVNSGWLEPLLDRVSINKVAIVSPIVDIIDPSDLNYKPSSLKLKAGFDWSLRFKWIPRSGEDVERFNDPTRPFISPMTYGGIFMIHKDWFNELGKFDDQLEIWGGESVEISIKAWLCGGQIEIVPCSRIGHIFRKKHPYTFPEETVSQTMLRNSKRIADNWLDEYKKFYYMERPLAKDEATVIDRKVTTLLKERLQCRPFSWFQQVIFPELKIPNKENVAYGELISDHKCLQITLVGQLEMSDCFSDDYVTTWALQNKTRTLAATSGGCLTTYSDDKSVGLEFCKADKEEFRAQQWVRSRGNLVNVQTRMCLENLGRTIGMSICRNEVNTQLWHFSVEIEQRN